MGELRPSPVPAARICSNDAPPAGAKSRPTTRASGNTSSKGGLTAAKPSSTTSALTETSERMKTCSGTASRQLSGTSRAPSRAQA